MDPDPSLALDDAVRATKPDYILLSCLYETRFGLTRKDLVEWAKARYEPRSSTSRCASTTTRCAGISPTRSSSRLRPSTARTSSNGCGSAPRSSPHRYTFICPRSGAISREEICSRLAATLAEMYRNEIDATGQPMSPDPFHAIENAIEHYRIDDILISTLKGEQSKWLEEGLIEKVQRRSPTSRSSTSSPGPSRRRPQHHGGH